MTRKLYLLPLEPLEERYTGQWYKWLPETFSRYFNVSVVDGEPLVAGAIEVGAFLDLNSTLAYKAAQLQRVASLFQRGLVRQGDAFWISDIEFWGMEAIRYLARLQGIEVFIFGFLHAGSYTRGDFMEPMADIGRWVEPAWVEACDRVYVGTEYHRRAFMDRRGQRGNHIVATGNPWRTQEARTTSKVVPYPDARDIDVLFPHRPDKEKGIERFLRVIDGQDWNVTFTTGRPHYRSTNCPAAAKQVLDMVHENPRRFVATGCDRAHFYHHLRRAKVVVSTSTEENFGYAMVEAMAMGAFPLMPSCASYPELVREDRRFLYNPECSDDLLRSYIDRAVREYHPDGFPPREDIVAMAMHWDGSEQRILDDMVATCEST